MSVEIKVPRKLIEVAIPLDDINKEAAKEKSIRHGHPSTIHLWWARRPLAAARAVLFAQLVNDPGYERTLGRGVNREKAEQEREKLFQIIRELCKWENINNRDLLEKAHREIIKSWHETCELNKNHPDAKDIFNKDKIPGFHDPFGGGGAIPFEAQRLGLESFSSDLNPVAVLINHAMLNLPQRFYNIKPINVASELHLIPNYSTPCEGLISDIKHYSELLSKLVFKKLEKIFPDYEISDEVISTYPELIPHKGKNLKVISWIWARTVRSENPKYSNYHVPLISSYVLSKNQNVALNPIVDIKKCDYKFEVVRNKNITDSDLAGTKSGRGANFNCIFSGSPIDPKYIKNEATSGRMGQKLICIVAEGIGGKGKLYLPASESHEKILLALKADWNPNLEISGSSQYIGTLGYGISNFDQLFTERQKIVLNEFCVTLESIYAQIIEDAKRRNFEANNKLLTEDTLDYAKAIITFLAFSIDKMADRGSTVCSWDASRDSLRNTFGRQAIQMTWDFAESNPFCESTGSFSNSVEWSLLFLAKTFKSKIGTSVQENAEKQMLSLNRIISTDPPYYDNIPYADLSDFFYVWLRRSLAKFYPDLFRTISVPKKEELVAFAYRHEDKKDAENFFMNGMKNVMKNISKISHPAFPITLYYAFKQSETSDENGTSSTGWTTFLEAIISSGYSISGTWPMRTELSNRMRSNSSNALASSIVLVCRKRTQTGLTISRRQFIRELDLEMQEALREMIQNGHQSPVAPVDLSQAIIGPGMAVFSKYEAVIEADGKKMSVNTALQLINKYVSEDDFDHDTQFCLSWFETVGWTEGVFGQADILARAKGTSVEGLRDGGVAKSSAGKFSLIQWQDLDENWSIETDNRTSHWEILHHMVRAYNKNGENNAGDILARIHSKSETIRALAYRMYTVCERKKLADDAANYNNLILAWEAIEMAAQSVGVKDSQISLFDNEPEGKVTTKKTKRKK